MHVHLPEADFGKHLIWRPKEVLCRYADLVVLGSEFRPFFEQNGPNLVLFFTSKYYLEVSNPDKKHGAK
jgi:hypothetical protein